MASWNGHTEIAGLLLAKEAQKDSVDANNETPLHYAAQYGHLEVCQLLMKNLIDKNPANHEFGNFNGEEEMAPYFFTWTPIESTKGRESNRGVMTVRPIS